LSSFHAYAEYYDLLNQGKNYREETKYLLALIQRANVPFNSLLDLGCGTGRHAELIAQDGYSVMGIDRSDEMIRQAINRKNELEKCRPLNLEFQQNDILQLNLNRQFDVVTSLFHVICYLKSANEIGAAFEVVNRHLQKGGLFVFDFWYGPAVLGQQPEKRVRSVENSRYIISRTAVPEHDKSRQVVTVNYNFRVQDKQTKSIDEFEESHPMRYLFADEAEAVLKRSGFELLTVQEWLSDRPINHETWSVVCVARKVQER